MSSDKVKMCGFGAWLAAAALGLGCAGEAESPAATACDRCATPGDCAASIGPAPECRTWACGEYVEESGVLYCQLLDVSGAACAGGTCSAGVCVPARP